MRLLMSLTLPPALPHSQPPLGAAISLGVHLALLLAIVWLSVVRPLDQTVPPPQSISVELVPLAAPPVPVVTPQLSAPTSSEPTAATSGATAAPAASAPTRPAAPAPLIKATTLFATSFLRDPANARLKKTLSTFADSEKIVQLCNMEGTEQIHRANPRFDPDVLVSYALSDFTVDGLTLIADGGAFHSGKSWTAIRLRCTVAADYLGVTDFQFAIGKPIPRSEWAAHGLPAEYQDSE